MRSQGVEVAYDEIHYRGARVRVRTRLQPVWLRRDDPLFLTTVIGDPDVGSMDYGKETEYEARSFHKALVERYQTLESARCDGIHGKLLEGVL